MTAVEIAGLAQLRSTPGILRSLTTALSEDEASRRPAPNRWSITEVIAHLGHVERFAMQGRIRAMLSESDPAFAAYDPNQHSEDGAYSGKALIEALDEFEQARAESLQVLEQVTPAQLDRRGVHGSLGPVTLREQLNELAFHDLGHVRQVAEIVRAFKYWRNMGPWQSAYKVNP